MNYQSSTVKMTTKPEYINKCKLHFSDKWQYMGSPCEFASILVMLFWLKSYHLSFLIWLCILTSYLRLSFLEGCYKEAPLSIERAQGWNHFVPTHSSNLRMHTFCPFSSKKQHFDHFQPSKAYEKSKNITRACCQTHYMCMVHWTSVMQFTRGQMHYCHINNLEHVRQANLLCRSQIGLDSTRNKDPSTTLCCLLLNSYWISEQICCNFHVENIKVYLKTEWRQGYIQGHEHFGICICLT